MTTLSTHDTKRSDDVRARLAVLSEMPAEFGRVLNRWSRMNNDLRAELFAGSAARDMPDRNTEYLLYQTLIGAWPITIERIQEYMLKAAREAKRQTSWTTNNVEFEQALHTFIAAVMQHAPFVTDLEQFVDTVQAAGRVNSLTQTLIKHTAPGVPDLYQGSELWDLSLVDPDNRRPVDYGIRAKLLREILQMPTSGVATGVMLRASEGLPKLWTIHQALHLRRERPQSFGAHAAYTPLKVEGGKAENVITYLRGEDVATVVPRLTVSVGGNWEETSVELPEGQWANRLTGASVAGGRVAMQELLRQFPVALLVKDSKAAGVKSDA